MRSLGLDVHAKATVACLPDGAGFVVEQTSIPTTADELRGLVGRYAASEPLLAGQEVAAAAVPTAARCRSRRGRHRAAR